MVRGDNGHWSQVGFDVPVISNLKSKFEVMLIVNNFTLRNSPQEPVIDGFFVNEPSSRLPQNETQSQGEFFNLLYLICLRIYIFFGNPGCQS